MVVAPLEKLVESTRSPLPVPHWAHLYPYTLENIPWFVSGKRRHISFLRFQADQAMSNLHFSSCQWNHIFFHDESMLTHHVSSLSGGGWDQHDSNHIPAAAFPLRRSRPSHRGNHEVRIPRRRPGVPAALMRRT